MKLRKLLISIMFVFLCSFMTVQAEGENELTEEVTSFEVEAVNSQNITLSWNAVTDVDGYVIYRSTEKDTQGDVLTTITSADTVSYCDDSVNVGETYYYTIQSYKEVDGERFYSGISKQVGKTARLKAIEITSITRKTYNKLVLEWEKNSKAEGYYIYRSESENGTYKQVARVKGEDSLVYTDVVPVCGKKYYYKVAAYITVNDSKYRGIYSEIVALNTRPTKTQFTDKTVSKSESVSFRWKESKGAMGYVIYRSTEKDANYKLVKTIEGVDTLKWTNTNRDPDVVYYYKIRPYTVVNDKKVYGLYSDVYEKVLIPKEIEEITEYTYVSYKSGGSSPNGWDCSGFTQWVYKNIYGMEIPRSSREQAKIGKSISKDDMSKWKPGDILVYAAGGSVNHVGLYLGNGKMMHALNTKYDTVIQDVDYYESWDSKNNLKSVRRCL